MPGAVGAEPFDEGVGASLPDAAVRESDDFGAVDKADRDAEESVTEQPGPAVVVPDDPGEGGDRWFPGLAVPSEVVDVGGRGLGGVDHARVGGSDRGHGDGAADGVDRTGDGAGGDPGLDADAALRAG